MLCSRCREARQKGCVHAVTMTTVKAHRSGELALAALLTLAMAACKGSGKERGPRDDAAPEVYKRPAQTLSELSGLCEGATTSYPGNPAYEKKTSAATPSKVAVFRKYQDDEKPAFKADEHDFGVMGAKDGDASSVEIVACVALKRSGEPGFCTYYGAEVKLYDMTHVVKLVEVATGKVLKEETFELKRGTERCAGTVTGSSYRGTNYTHRLLAMLLPFEPDGVALPPTEFTTLENVCVGSAIPQAAAYTKSGKHPTYLVYFPFAMHSSTTDDVPENLGAPGSSEQDVGAVQLVACVTGEPQKKRAACEFTGGKTLELSDGEFEVAVMEAKTGKLVEKKRFKGTSGTCPISHSFWGTVDKVMTKIDPSFAPWLKQLEGG